MRPGWRGRPVEIRYRSGLADSAGNPAHAASFIRRRLILLDRELRHNTSEHARILLHELFHFVWIRLGNPGRLRWEREMRTEISRNVPGEAGWSAEWRKLQLERVDLRSRTRRWREYCCESFCDTGAAWFAGGPAAAAIRECTLPPGVLKQRLAWFSEEFGTRDLPI